MGEVTAKEAGEPHRSADSNGNDATNSCHHYLDRGRCGNAHPELNIHRER
jgi:hypothetical protein